LRVTGMFGHCFSLEWLAPAWCRLLGQPPQLSSRIGTPQRYQKPVEIVQVLWQRTERAQTKEPRKRAVSETWKITCLCTPRPSSLSATTRGVATLQSLKDRLYTYTPILSTSPLRLSLTNTDISRCNRRKQVIRYATGKPSAEM
jgi:hypothetical protein